MQTMHPTLLIGPADWDDEQMPREEFKARLDALWRDDWQAGGAIVYGDSAYHAELTYLTHFTPKLEPGIALLSRSGEAKLLVGGGINMIPAAKPLTWVGQLLPLRGAAQTVAEWYAGLPAGSGVMLVGGDAMPYAMRNEIVAALGPEVSIGDGTPIVQELMLRKSPRELAAVKEASIILREAFEVLQQAKEQGVSVALLAAEHVAWQRGAQDVRSLFSLDGGRTLVPFDVPVPQVVDPLQIYLAVRHGGYWAEGFAMLSSRPHPPLIAAEAALAVALERISCGMVPYAVTDGMAEAMPAFAPHPIAAPPLVGIGLSLQQAVPPNGMRPGQVLSVRAGVSDPQQGAAIVSAMVAVNENRHDVYWSAAWRPLNHSPTLWPDTSQHQAGSTRSFKRT